LAVSVWIQRQLQPDNIQGTTNPPRGDSCCVAGRRGTSNYLKIVTENDVTKHYELKIAEHHISVSGDPK